MYTLVVLALLFGMCYGAPQRLAELLTNRDPVPNQYIVIFKNTADVDTDATTIAALAGVHVRQKYYSVAKGVAVSLTDDSALDRIRKLDDVSFVEQDGNVNISAVDNSNLALTWGLDRVDQRKLPLDGQDNFNGDGDGVHVYIIDTGIYPEHEYFGGRARIAYDATGGNGRDCNGHGTHCAGTVGANGYGIATKAKLWGVRVLNCWGGGYWSDVIAGMDFVATSGIRPAVVSMSLGGWRNTAVNNAVQRLYEAGVPVSAAAGNSNWDACYFSPAMAPSAITVGATSSGDYRAYFSNYGSCVDIFAPGLYVLSTAIGSPTATATYSGTSMACPHVSGAIAVALGNDNSLTPEQVWEKLKGDSTSGVLQNKGTLSPDRMLYIP